MPPEFYPEELTDQSRRVLDRVVAAAGDAILIGGWATWVRAGGPMSHDIDMIVGHDDLDALRGHVDDLSTSTNVAGQKWRATLEGIHLDLYVPYQSRLGGVLQLRVEDLASRREQVDRWSVLAVPAHTSTKIAALLDRPDTMPGKKDRVEILSLLPNTTPGEVLEVIAASSERDLDDLRGELTDRLFEYLGETDGLGKKERHALTVDQRTWDSEIARIVGPPPVSPAQISAVLATRGDGGMTTGRVRPYDKADGTRVKGHPRRRKGR